MKRLPKRNDRKNTEPRIALAAAIISLVAVIIDLITKLIR